MSRPRLILIGAGGHARACIEVIEQHGLYQIAGLVGRPEEMHVQHFGYSVIAADHDLPNLSKVYQYVVIAVGQIQSPDIRIRLYQQAVELGFELPHIVAPTAHVSRHATIGAGTMVMHGAILNAGSRVGNNCIVNTRSLLEHDTTVEDHCHIATGAILNGGVKVGVGSFIGSGSVIREGVSLGSRCLVGAGLTVRHNQAEHVRFVGGDKS
jgi:sugar O-acyltransferase (sialic acid O-acetyltransferase NeuD family)